MLMVNNLKSARSLGVAGAYLHSTLGRGPQSITISSHTHPQRQLRVSNRPKCASFGLWAEHQEKTQTNASKKDAQSELEASC